MHFRKGLRDLGLRRPAKHYDRAALCGWKGDRIPRLVAELVQLNVDVLVFGTLTAIRAAKQAITTIPIVMITKLIRSRPGLVDSLGAPRKYHRTYETHRD